MSQVTDYQQPDFFRFGWDQFYLVDQVVQQLAAKKYETVVELGVGSGVVICELSQRICLGTAHLVEYQQAAWEAFLMSNLKQFSRAEEHIIHWQKVSEFNLDRKIQASLIVCNPPYFVVKDGRPSPDERRNIAHRLVVDPWQAWVDAMVRTLAPGGEAWWLHRDPGPRGKPDFPSDFQWQHVARSGRMRVIRLSRLDIK